MDRKQLYLYDGDTFEVEGLTFKVKYETDIDSGPPWEQGDGYGIVSDWTSRDKRPGERTLCSDRGSKRYYDWQETMKRAKQEGWGLTDEDKAALILRLAQKTTVRRKKRVGEVEQRFGGLLQQRTVTTEVVTITGRDPSKPLTKGEITAEAVRKDYEFLRGWCNDQWSYVGVTVTLMVEDEDGELVESDDPELEDSLWGVETFDDYHMEVAYENAGNIVRVYHEKQAAAAREEIERIYWAERDVETL